MLPINLYVVQVLKQVISSKTLISVCLQMQMVYITKQAQEWLSLDFLKNASKDFDPL